MQDRRKAAGLGAIAALCLGMIVWMLLPASSTPAAPDGVWSRNAALAKGRELVLYKPSPPESNYWIEFTWVPDSKGIEWIYRVHDTANYYAVRLRPAQPAASGALIAEHFSVSSGVEGPPVRKIVKVAAAGGPVTVRLEVSGASFTLALQNIVADFWTDSRLDTGDLGFVEESGDRPSIRALKLTLFRKTGSKIISTILP